MLLISVDYTDLLLRFKAPKGLQYKISGICFSNINVVAGVVVFVVDYLAEDELTDSMIRTVPNIAAWNSALSSSGIFINNMDHKTKFITIAKNSTAPVRTIINIYGDLVPISRTEAILEWFRKGR